MLKTISTITNALGALNYKGTWNASTNTPALASGSGTKGDYYVVSVAGSTSLDGISNWGVGDWAAFNGTAWQRVEGGADLNGVNLSVSGTATLSGGTANGVTYLNGSKELTSGSALTFDGTNLANIQSTAAPIGLRLRNGSVSTSAGTRVSFEFGGSVTGFVGNQFDGGDFNTQYSTSQHHIWYRAGTEQMRINSAGDLVLVGSTAQKATGTTWSNPSDQRLKDNIRDYSKGLAELMQVRVREWEYNGKGGTVEGNKGLGVIADEVMLVLPDTVGTYEAKLNADDEKATDIKKFDATEITWLLVKTVQEQQAQIEILKAEFAALKGA